MIVGCVPKIVTKDDIAEAAEFFQVPAKNRYCTVRFTHIRAELLNKCSINTCGLKWLRIGSSHGLLLT